MQENARCPPKSSVIQGSGLGPASYIITAADLHGPYFAWKPYIQVCRWHLYRYRWQIYFLRWNPYAYLHTLYIYSKYKCIGIHFPSKYVMISVYLRWNFSGGRQNFCSLRRGGVSAVQGHPRSINLVPILSCKISEIWQVLCAPDPTLFNPDFGGVPVAPDRPCWGQPAHKP